MVRDLTNFRPEDFVFDQEDSLFEFNSNLVQKKLFFTISKYFFKFLSKSLKMSLTSIVPIELFLGKSKD